MFLSLDLLNLNLYISKQNMTFVFYQKKWFIAEPICISKVFLSDDNILAITLAGVNVSEI